MKFRNGWSSHLPMLVKTLQISKGPVLELGMGLFSTPLLHWMCQDQDKELVSYDHDPLYFKTNLTYASNRHKVLLTDDWDKIDIDNTHWGLVFIDHAPAKRRKTDIRRLKDKADFIVCHDTQPEDDKFYKYHWIWKDFKYVYHYTKASPNTSVLSNFYDVAKLLG